MRYYLIAGEPSGDLHGANLIEGLRKADPEVQQVQHLVKVEEA